MGVENSKLRFTEAKRLLDYGFANYESITLGKKRRYCRQYSN